jgi:murein DD-endopeptidase MepM/ murein hydrolase activator NlpD
MNAGAARGRWIAGSLVAVMALSVVACADDPNDADTAAGASPTTSGATSEATTETTTDGTTAGAVEPGAGIVEEVLTPIVAFVTTEPTPVMGTSERVYLAYELLVINATTVPVTIDSLQAIDAAGGAVLQEYSGADLVAHSLVIGNAPTEPPSSVALAGGQAALLWLDPSVAAGEEVPAALQHQLTATFDEPPNELLPAEVTETIAAAAVGTTPAPVIASPLEGPNWFDGNGCCDVVTPHRGAANPINGQYFLAERFGVDWVQLDDNMQIFDGPQTEMSSYAYYDAPIYAVADGTIEIVADGLPDQPPGANPPAGSLQVTEFGGNHVVQRFEQNGQTYYAFYAHLVPGSASESVQVGQEVKAGDVVGRLGNSGNSDAPHLHFHVMDTPNPLASNGLPYVFESLDLVGTADGEEALIASSGGEPVELTPGGPTGQREDEMPLYLDVVNLQPAGD